MIPLRPPLPCAGRPLSSCASEPTDRLSASPISLVSDIGTGAGLSAASGVRPFIPPLLAGALARGDRGLDFDGTSYAFLESTWFLLVVLGVAVVSYALQRRGSAPNGRRGRTQELGTAALGLALGALLFAGVLAEHHPTSWPGLIGGAAAAALGFLALARLFTRARRRLVLGAEPAGPGAAGLLDVYADGLSLVVAAVAIAWGPAAYALLAALAVLAVAGGRRRTEKYQGLRILR